MTTTQFGQTQYQTQITLTGFSGGITSGTANTSQQFANPLMGGATASYPSGGDLIITLGTSTTTGSGAPYLQATILRSNTSGGGEIRRVSSNQIFPYGGSSQEPLIPSFTYTAGEEIIIKDLEWPAAPYLTVVINNQSGVNLPSTMTANLVPYGYVSG